MTIEDQRIREARLKTVVSEEPINIFFKLVEVTKENNKLKKENKDMKILLVLANCKLQEVRNVVN